MVAKTFRMKASYIGYILATAIMTFEASLKKEILSIPGK